jgi:PhnB protein
MQVQPYLFFDGRCEEAVEFYKSKLGAKVEMLMRFKDNPEPMPSKAPPGDKVMHACLRIGDTAVMASDGNCTDRPSFQGFSLSFADGGQVQMPLGKTFFSPCFGMVADRFGVGWMVIAAPKETYGR